MMNDEDDDVRHMAEGRAFIVGHLTRSRSFERSMSLPSDCDTCPHMFSVGTEARMWLSVEY